MVYVRKEIEITVRFKNQPGRMEKLLQALTNEGISLLAHTTYLSRDWMLVLLITDKLNLTRRVLEEEGFEYGSDSIVLVDVPGRSWFVAQIGIQLHSAGIGILYSYVSDPLADHFVAVFKTTDDSRAVRVLQNGIPWFAPQQTPIPIEGGSHVSAS